MMSTYTVLPTTVVTRSSPAPGTPESVRVYVRLAGANRAESALPLRSYADAIHDDVEALRTQLVDRGIHGPRTGRGGVGGCCHSKRRCSQRARGEGGENQVLHGLAFLVSL
jgi:hypothetical protein